MARITPVLRQHSSYMEEYCQKLVHSSLTKRDEEQGQYQAYLESTIDGIIGKLHKQEEKISFLTEIVAHTPVINSGEGG